MEAGNFLLFKNFKHIEQKIDISFPVSRE